VANLPSSGKFFLAWVKFWSGHTRFVVANGKNILYCALQSWGKSMPGWIILLCLGNVTQPVVEITAVYMVIALELCSFVVILKFRVKSGNEISRSGKISDIFHVWHCMAHRA